MALWEPDEIDLEFEYDKADAIDDDNLNKSINELNYIYTRTGRVRQ